MTHKKIPFLIPGYTIENSEERDGTVLLARDRANGKRVAIKCHDSDPIERGISYSTLRETSFLRLLSGSPHIVKLLDVVHEASTAHPHKLDSYSVLERMDCNLSDYAKRTQRFAVGTVQRIIYQVLLGLHHSHSVGVLHRRLTPQSIWLDTSNADRPLAKLADFGAGRSFAHFPVKEMTSDIFSLWYCPPEVLLGFAARSAAVDIWSAACILIELCEKEVAFEGKHVYDMLNKIFGLLGTPTADKWPQLRACGASLKFPAYRARGLWAAFPKLPIGVVDLVEKMLSLNPVDRPTAEDCLRHHYFASIFKKEDLQIAPLMAADILMPRPDPDDDPPYSGDSAFCAMPKVPSLFAEAYRY